MKVKRSRYRPGVAQRVGRVIALLFLHRGTRRGWVVSSTPRPQFTPGRDPVPILQEARWAPGPVWKGGKSRPHRDSIPDRPARSQSLYRLSYRAHTKLYIYSKQLNNVWARQTNKGWRLLGTGGNIMSYISIIIIIINITGHSEPRLHVDHVSPSRGPPGSIMWPKTTFVNCKYCIYQTFHYNLGN